MHLPADLPASRRVALIAADLFTHKLYLYFCVHLRALRDHVFAIYYHTIEISYYPFLMKLCVSMVQQVALSLFYYEHRNYRRF